MGLYILRCLSPKTALTDHWITLDPRIPWQLTLCKESPIVSDSVYLIGSPSISVIVYVYVYVWHDWATFTSLHFTSQWCYPPWSQPIKDCPGVANPCLSFLKVQRPGHLCVCVCVCARSDKLSNNINVSHATHYPGNFENVFCPSPHAGKNLSRQYQGGS